MEPAQRSGRGLRTTVAAVLLLVGIASLGLWRVFSGGEDLPFAKGATPPTYAHVTKDKTYSLAVPGGVQAMLDHGVPEAGSQSGELINLQCQWSSGRLRSQALPVTAESTATKATETVGHFDGPITGNIHVDCDSWGAMFVPDADNRGADTSGWAMVLAVVTLTIGAGIGLSEFRRVWESNHRYRDEDDDEYADDARGFAERGSGELGY